MEAWKNNPDNNKNSRAGDDRTPAFRWLGCLYMDEVVCVPSDYISAALMKAAARVPIPGGKNGKTFKQDSMSGMSVEEPNLTLMVGGKEIAESELDKLRSEKVFAVHQKRAEELGFHLFIKRAKIGQKKHIRVRPRFDNWALSGTIAVWDDKLNAALPEIFNIAGSQIGLGDWRPSSPSNPGPFGRFAVEVKNAS